MVEGVRPDGTHIGGEEVLSMLVFELLNASHRDEFKALDAAASERKIGKENYIEGMAKVEFTTALELKHFAVHLWPQNAVKRGMPWNHPFWKQGTVESFDIYLRTIRGMHDGYPDDVFGPRYDALSKGEVH